MNEGSKFTLRGINRHESIIWVLLVTVLWYIIICEFISEILFARVEDTAWYGGLSSEVKFTVEYYGTTVVAFIGILVYARVTKWNRFVLRTFLPGYGGNRFSMLMKGLLAGFVMNFGCILCALIHGNIKLYPDFALSQIPFYLFALVLVFIQSTSEELWCRGLIYERINVRYPLWVAILVNGAFFGLLHVMNPGAAFLPILDICICGLSFSIAKWYTNSIWFPMGIHTAWNFTQNYLFGLPNSGLVSEASVFKLDAANAVNDLIYNVTFGVEGAVPAVLSDFILGIVCMILIVKKGRLGELRMTVRDRGDHLEFLEPKEEPPRYVYRDPM